MTNLDLVKELVNAFNVDNYGSKVNTNFVVEGDNIVVKFNCDKSSAKRYLSQMARDLVREYYSDESVARYAFDLGSLPFNLDKGKWTYSGAVTKLTVPIDNGVIFNLKVHFAEGFVSGVETQMIKEISGGKHYSDEKYIKVEEALNKNIEQVKMDPSSGYIKCLLFSSTNVQKYFERTLQAKMQEYDYSNLNFYDIDCKNKKIYFRDVEDIGFIRSVTEVSKKEVGYNFYLQHSDNLKVKARHYKDAVGELIFCLTGISIYRYYYDGFIDKDRRGGNFAFIPVVKDGSNLRYLTYMEADKINAKFSHDILTDVKGQTEATSKDEYIRSGIDRMYAFSDRQIALLIPVIIENSVINKDGQIEIDPGLYEKLQAPLTELDSPRHELGVLLRHNVGAAEVVTGGNVQAGTSARLQNRWLPQSTHENKWMPSLQFNEPEQKPSLWPQSEPSSSKGADGSMLTGSSTWYVPLPIPPLTTRNDPTSRSPGVEDMNGVEPEEQQVSDECSEAKPQGSESPEKKHGGGVQKIKKLFFSPFKKQYDVNLKQHDVGRDTTRSTPETPVTERLPVFKLFHSFPTRIRAKSNPPSEVTSPTHEGVPGGLKPLTSDERNELRPFLSPELQKKLDSNSFSPGKEQHLYLTHTLSGKRELSRFQYDSEQSQLLRLTEAQLPDNPSFKRDNGYSSGFPASPAVPHKKGVSSGFEECSTQQVKLHSVEHT